MSLSIQSNPDLYVLKQSNFSVCFGIGNENKLFNKAIEFFNNLAEDDLRQQFFFIAVSRLGIKKIWNPTMVKKKHFCQ
jgi:hypothetical protein